MLIDQNNSVGVLQGEIAFTSADAERYVLGTHTTLTCVNLAVYNPSTKQLAFVHLDAASIKHFSEICDLIKKKSMLIITH